MELTSQVESENRSKLELALRYIRAIASLGGNLPDERLISRTGPNDSVARGNMYVESRRLATEAQKLLETL